MENRLDQMTLPTNEGSMSKPDSPTEDATQTPFSFGPSGFRINYVCRESVTRLRKLCFPEELKSEKARKSARHDGSIMDRPWIKAQLQHYGIDFSPNIDPFKAKALLLTSIAHGLVSKSTLVRSISSSSVNTSIVRYGPTSDSQNRGHAQGSVPGQI